jgi:recombinase
VPCPPAADPGRNPHRTGTGWTLGTVATILSNPRYTGQQVWNRQRTDRDLADPADVSLGHKSVQRWNLPDGGSSPARTATAAGGACARIPACAVRRSMEPIGWVTQIEPIWHGAPHNRLRPDARSCRIADAASSYILCAGPDAAMANSSSPPVLGSRLPILRGRRSHFVRRCLARRTPGYSRGPSAGRRSGCGRSRITRSPTRGSPRICHPGSAAVGDNEEGFSAFAAAGSAGARETGPNWRPCTWFSRRGCPRGAHARPRRQVIGVPSSCAQLACASQVW